MTEIATRKTLTYDEALFAHSHEAMLTAWIATGANLRAADLSAADLSDANLRAANLSGANLSAADLSDANLSGANLSAADLSDANLSAADLSYANLRAANLSGANLSAADLSDANLSAAVGLLSPMEFIRNNFECILRDGIVIGFYAYKVFNLHHNARPDWKIEPGAIITEVCNANRTDDCGCGINVAYRNWNDFGDSPLWKIKISGAQMLSVVVPYNTNGKIRVGECELVEIEAQS